MADPDLENAFIKAMDAAFNANSSKVKPTVKPGVIDVGAKLLSAAVSDSTTIQDVIVSDAPQEGVAIPVQQVMALDTFK